MGTLAQNSAARGAARQAAKTVTKAPVLTQSQVKNNIATAKKIQAAKVVTPVARVGNTTPVINSRNAQIQSGNQLATHQQAVLKNQLQGITDSSNKFALDLKEGRITKAQHDAQQEGLARMRNDILSPIKKVRTSEDPYAGFKTLKDAQDANNAYYIRTGSSDPAAEAAIHNFQNPNDIPQATTRVVTNDLYKNIGSQPLNLNNPLLLQGYDLGTSQTVENGQLKQGPIQIKGRTPENQKVIDTLRGKGLSEQQIAMQLKTQQHGEFKDGKYVKPIDTMKEEAKNEVIQKWAKVVAEGGSRDEDQMAQDIIDAQQKVEDDAAAGKTAQDQKNATNANAQAAGMAGVKTDAEKKGDEAVNALKAQGETDPAKLNDAWNKAYDSAGGSGSGTNSDDPFASMLSGLDPSIAKGMKMYLDKASTRIKSLEDAQAQGMTDLKTSQDEIKQIKQAAEDRALQQKKDQMEFDAKQQALDLQSLENDKKTAQDDLARQEAQSKLDFDKAYHDQQITNIETEMQNRNAAAKLGINYDTGGLKWMQDQTQKGVDALSYLSKQAAVNDLAFANKAVEISRNYTQAYKQTLMDGTKAYNLAVKDYNDSIGTAGKDYATESKSLREFYATHQEKLATDVYNIDKDIGDKFVTLNKDLNDQANKLRDDKRTQQNDLRNMWNDHLSNHGNTDPDGAQGILDLMKAAGMDTTPYNINAPTISQTEKAAKDAASKGIEENIGKYVDKKSGNDLVSVLDSSTTDLPVGKIPSKVSYGLSLLKQGKTKEFKALLLSNARSGMDGDTHKKVIVYDGFLKGMDNLESTINDMSPDDFGWWKSMVEKGKTYTEVEKDPRFNKIKASIGFFQAQLRTPLFGAALSPQEKVLADDFMANFETDEMGTVVDKLNQLRESLDLSAQVAYDNQLGDGVYQNYIKGDNTRISDLPSTPAYEGTAADDYFRTGSGTGMRTDRNNNPTAMTTDVAKTAGLVEGVDYEQGDAFPNNPNIYTAKLIGDPVAVTIKAIDKAGFKTKKGQSRWTYTDELGLTNEEWSKMSYEEKKDAIRKMYQREGGNGSLFQLS